MTEMVRSLAVAGEFARDAQRRSHLLHQLDRVVADTRRGIESEHDRNEFLALAARVRGFLENPDRTSCGTILFNRTCKVPPTDTN